VDILMLAWTGNPNLRRSSRRTRILRGTPVIMLSSKGRIVRSRAPDGGSDEYLTKPFTKDSL